MKLFAYPIFVQLLALLKYLALSNSQLKFGNDKS